MASDLTKVGALWLRDSKAGSKFMAGKIEQSLPEGAGLLIFKNSYKKEDRHPDFEIFVKQAEPPDDNVPPQGPSAAQTRNANEATSADDIPF